MTVAEAATANAFTVERDGDMLVVWFDLPGEKVNKFSGAVLRELDGLLDQIRTMSDVRFLVFASKKQGIFIAGADINEFTRVTSMQEAEDFTRFGQRVFLKVGALPQVTVAAINGACVGGGCELAINCDYRVMSDHPKATIGLPEVKLGIFPAWTGTTRLPRLIGIPAALDIILNGKTLDARRARRVGLVDEVVAPAILLDAAKTFVRKQAGKRHDNQNRTHLYIEGNPLARKLIFSKARKAVLDQTRGNYPAPLKAIEIMELGFSRGHDSGLEAEARGASELINDDVAKNLVQLFFLMEGSKKDRSGAEPRLVRAAGVLGAGVMGGGIAQLIADKADINVRMKDINWEALAGGLRAASRIWKKKVDRRRMTRGEMARKMARITVITDWTGFDGVDVAIEAVVENLSVKQQVLSEFEAIARSDAFFASNTSTIPITRIAARAARPENVVGMHFFNPVDKMPLVEVIVGEKSSPVAVSTVADFARKMGKTVVVCKDGPGFVVNRILAPYMNEAAFLLEEGMTMESIDKALLDFGMPLGPYALLDEVGIDVASKSGKIFADAFADRIRSSNVIQKLYDDKRLGRKSGRGAYIWKDGKRIKPDPAVYQVLGVTNPRPGQPANIVERLLLPMINEAALLLEEKIAASAGEVDLAMIMGTGFPPFRGGLLRYADQLGSRHVVDRLEHYASTVGPRYEPSAPLVRLAESGKTFYEKYSG